ncbi:MAG: hypothetical protein N3A72_08130 [bacterium]|nr:hypothetical protein [bacterium]
MGKVQEGSTRQLITFCAWYFFLYVITGVAVKYFTGPADKGLLGVGEMEYLVYNTIGGSLICLAIVFLYRWYRLKSNQLVPFGKWKIPVEIYYIIPSGICTAVVIPTTTLMYLLPISVMVAMVIMRGSIIVISRIIDAIQIKQGILHKKVYWEEEVAVIFAIIAVSVHIIFGKKAGGFDFLHSPAAMAILGSYLTAYFIRLYIMNYFRNTRGKGVPQDNKGFFAIEQIAASSTMFIVGLILFYLVRSDAKAVVLYQQALSNPTKYWPWEIASGLPYGILAFFSVFLFMFKGRTATFAGLSNRLTSLVAGTTATLLFAVIFGGKYPKKEDWISLIFIFIAVGFLARAEKKRIAELKAQQELG